MSGKLRQTENFRLGLISHMRSLTSRWSCTTGRASWLTLQLAKRTANWSLGMCQLVKHIVSVCFLAIKLRNQITICPLGWY